MVPGGAAWRQRPLYNPNGDRHEEGGLGEGGWRGFRTPGPGGSGTRRVQGGGRGAVCPCGRRGAPGGEGAGRWPLRPGLLKHSGVSFCGGVGAGMGMGAQNRNLGEARSPEKSSPGKGRCCMLCSCWTDNVFIQTEKERKTLPAFWPNSPAGLANRALGRKHPALCSVGTGQTALAPSGLVALSL